MQTNNGDLVLLVRVSPNMIAEDRFMKHLSDIQEATHYTKIACQLHALFGWVTPVGEPFNQYELDFDSEQWFLYSLDFLTDWFYRLTIEDPDFDLDGEEILPQVLYARRRTMKEEN